MSECFNGIVYMFTNSINDKKYIGITTKILEERYKNHIWNINDGSYFHNAIKKYGIENFTLEIIDKAHSEKELKEKEKYWIKFYNTRKQGYNLTDGGDGVWGYKHTEETKEYLREINTGSNNHRYGKEISMEQKLKLIERFTGENNHNYGKPMNDEIKKKISNTKIKNGSSKGNNNPNYGKKHNKETKQKMSDNHADFSGGNHPQAMEIIQLTKDDIFINIFPSSKEASEHTGADRSHIIKCCKNKAKTAKGFKWMYKKDYDSLRPMMF